MNNLTIQKVQNFIFVSYSCDNHLVIYNLNSNKYVVLEHSNNILHSWQEYFSDSEKNVYKIELLELFELKETEFNLKDDLLKLKTLTSLLEEKDFLILKTSELLEQGKLKHMRKLKKNISKSSGDYLIDNFGDVLDANGEVLTGTLCSAIDFQSNNDFIIIADKYNKIRILTLDGKILRFIFTSSQIYSFCLNGEDLYVLTKENLDIYDIESGKLVKTVDINGGVLPNDSLFCAGKDVYIIRDSKLLDLDLNVLFDNEKYLFFNEKLLRIITI
ncbi:hypothetical protein NBO_6g0088 [Nosema bombycis CQ1]|uniref:Uncharacterized protein n=1 Tax=Nosema bombycis (strain CQ1 / CVCC 102059) TaxID=578461 RepID=R0KYR2_NOSB1|nr:hypothetical protein NBO_6g0088 [Nosema bombycis CQ1]|eukprot:EOB15337.1 hypothetical protein NBO_6g0088 [Nosema bombycis CQ1]